MNLSRVVDMWTNALKAGKKGKEAALRAAMGILSSQPPPSANAATGISAVALNHIIVICIDSQATKQVLPPM